MTRPVAFLFPGQGSQFVGMLADLAVQFSVVKETFDEASQALGFDLWQLCSEGPDGVLNKTQNTQPALLAVSVALWRLWLAEGGSKPVVMAGHSLGEYSALTCAGVLDFADAVKLVAERGRLMQAAVPEGEGAMAAVIGLDNKVVGSVCQEAAQGDVVTAVNYNSPGQIVIAGSKVGVDRALVLAKAQGAKRCLLLPVSIPSHCLLMKPAAAELAVVMDGLSFHKPQIPVINNVDVDQPRQAEKIKDALVRQLYHPVCWVESIKKIQVFSVRDMVECGPGKVLSGLNKRIDRDIQSFSIGSPDGLVQALSVVNEKEAVDER